MGFLGILAIIAILLVLFGIKIASTIAGTPLNIIIALCLLSLSIGGERAFSLESHSLIIVTLSVASDMAMLLLIGVCFRLVTKLAWK